MRKSALIMGALAATLSCSFAAAPAIASEKLTGEQQLAKILAGRVPGKPVSCISFSDHQDMQVIDKTAIVFGFGQTLYVNRPKNAADLDSGMILVTKSFSSDLCNVDIVRLRDQTTHMESGFITLGDFVPYTKAP